MVFASRQSSAQQLDPAWRSVFWAAAIIVALLLYGFEFLQTILFPQFRAPNVGVIVQLLIMLGFYLSWIIVPRIIWYIYDRFDRVRANNQVRFWTGLLASGIGLSIIHISVLAWLKLLMFAQIDFGIVTIASSSAELWLGYSAFWLILYGFTALLIHMFRNRLQNSRASEGKLEVRQNGKIFVLIPNDIFWVEALGNYAQIHTDKGQYTVRQSLNKIHDKIGHSAFFRAHRQAVVNVAKIKSINTHHGKSYSLEFFDAKPAPLSRRKLSDLKALIKAA